MKSWRAWVRWIAIIVYLVAIPLCLLTAAGAVFITDEGSHVPHYKPVAAAALAAAVLLGWRMWLNLRAGGFAKVGGGRLLLVYLPLGLLAVCGVLVVIMAIGYGLLGVWIVTSGNSSFPVGAFPELERTLSIAMIIGLSLLVAAIGAVMIWPFARLIRRNMSQTLA